MSDLYIEARLQAIKDIASASCADIKDADNIASFCDEIYDKIPKLDKIISQLGDYGNEEINYYRNTPYENCIRECISKAIEIVNQGSGGPETDTIKDKTVKRNNNSSKQMPYEDMCEWIRVKNKNAYKCYTHAEIYDSRVLDWCKCPYCGKEVKITD